MNDTGMNNTGMNDTGINDAGVSLDAVRRIADAVLYEGYILYPYRASSQKNRSRWQFGVVMAPGYAAVDPSESSVTQSEWVLEHSGQPTVQVILRFLQVQRRSTEGAAGAWDEAMEREIEFTAGPEELLGPGLVREFSVPGGEDREPSPDARIAVRRREPRPAWFVFAPPRCRAHGGRSGSRSGWRIGPRPSPRPRSGTTRCRPRWSPRT